MGPKPEIALGTAVVPSCEISQRDEACDRSLRFSVNVNVFGKYVHTKIPKTQSLCASWQLEGLIGTVVDLLENPNAEAIADTGAVLN